MATAQNKCFSIIAVFVKSVEIVTSLFLKLSDSSIGQNKTSKELLLF